MARFEDLAGLAPDRAAALAEAVSSQHMLHEVVAWMATQPGAELGPIVEQDEFTNDVTVQLLEPSREGPASAGERGRMNQSIWLVYDCS